MHIEFNSKSTNDIKSDNKYFSKLFSQITTYENINHFNDLINFVGYDINEIEIGKGEIIGPDGKDVWDMAQLKYEEMLATGELRRNKKYANFNIYDYKQTYNNFAKYNPFGQIENNPYKNLLVAKH